MPTYELTSPQGEKFQITAPDDATPDQVMAYASQHFGKPEERSGLQELARQVGLTARAGINAVTGLGGAIADIPFRAANALGANVSLPSENQQRLLTKAGLPEPETSTERLAQGIAGGMAGAATGVGIGGLMAGGASPVTQGVGLALQQSPRMQVFSGATGGAAAQQAAESGAGPIGQTVAGMAGAIAPSAIQAGAQAAVRGAARGGSSGSAKMDQRLQNFEQVGAEPSVSQATGNDRTQILESALAKLPGGAGVMTRAAQKQAAEMGAKVDAMAEALVPNATTTTAGLTVERGIKAFMDRFKTTRNELYNKLDEYIPSDKLVDVSNTKTTLEALNADIPGAPNLSRFFKNSTIQGVETAMKADLENPVVSAQLAEGKLPYEAVKKLRTLVGDQMDTSPLISSVPRNKWNSLYAALSQDLQGAAREQGPQATQAWVRANAFNAAGHTRIEDFLNRIAGQNTVEKMYSAATGEVKQGASTINAVMRSLEPDERKMVTSAFVKRMGLAVPSAQGAEGETFSVNTFLSNWNKVTPEAKNILFGRHAPGLKQDLTHLAQVADEIKRSASVFANPSGTTPAWFTVGGVTSAATAAITGHPVTAAMVLGGMGSANITARMMTSPSFVRWLARSTRMNPASIPSQIENLTWVAANQKDSELKANIRAYQSALQTQQ